ncbi:hypothetical protein IMCC1989_2711 [gamma proteobacterium IMCC1989]|nr:hypothetical protein IMCC1989_2711 [gamma proteobacterium IMCC1989]
MYYIDDFLALLFGISLLIAFWKVRTPLFFIASGACLTIIYSITLFFISETKPVQDIIFYSMACLGCISGLLFIRVMLIRSISLHALKLSNTMTKNKKECSIEDQLTEQMTSEIGFRLDDLQQKGFATLTTDGSGQLTLTPKGRVIAQLVSRLYRAIER